MRRGIRPLRGLAALAAAVAAGCGAPADGELPPAVEAPVAVGADTLNPGRIRAYLEDALGFTSRGGRMFCSYEVLGRAGDRVFLGTVCEELLPEGDSLGSGSGRGGPVALVVDTAARPARITGHLVPGDGGLYRRDVERIFPPEVRRRIDGRTEEHAERVAAMRRAVREAARAFYGAGSVAS